ncbi:hypothetical protein U3450_003951 [Bacillus cytotoxicus]|uniref:hypothetical protein n=1 Tax=unclassified Bacillus cereus group TaxID=2750818 RepID=UPI001F56DAFF|nr:MULTISPECIES: hypothetical protein [unclassified Bacillus cereus group]EMA6344893.1 hypothetical protein [Bacillus cytotoxicus]
MPEFTERLKLPLPLGNEYVKREMSNNIFKEIDKKVATLEDIKETLESAIKHADIGDEAVNKSLEDAVTSLIKEIDKKVDKSGDTMTDDLVIQKSLPALILKTLNGKGEVKLFYNANDTNDHGLQLITPTGDLLLRKQGEAGIKTVATTDVAQMKKITNDNGSQTISVSNSSQNILDEILAKGAGLNTIYCNGGVQGQTPANVSWRGISFLNQSDIGFVMAKDYNGNFWTNYINGKHGWVGWVRHASIDDVNKTQVKKITQDDGGPTISISDTSKNILDEILARGKGMNTIYCNGGVQGQTPNNKSWRGISFLNSTGYGFVMAKDYQNKFFTNYLDNGSWLGWTEHPNSEQVTVEINKRTEDGVPSRSGKDENGIYTVYEEAQEDGKLRKKSVLSNPDADGNYLVRTVTYYKNGIAYKTKVFDLKYDDDGDFVKAVPR